MRFRARFHSVVRPTVSSLALLIAALLHALAHGVGSKPEHWAFSAPVRPDVPQSVGMPGRVRNPVDAFVQARLTPAGLAPSPEAPPHEILRRVWLDLTGLPPSPREVAEFEADQSPEAYERAVDRALASPRFGERWAKTWLDLARYADSTGYGKDSLRLNIWPWRDWVIDWFNANKPYDTFTLEQLAGDLLPAATPSQIAATAFHRNTMTNTEDGTEDEEFRVAAVHDRVATTGQVWMGLTLGCAQCHSHKFDPISQRDYYGLFAILNQTQDADRTDESPRIPLETEHEQQERSRLGEEIAALQAKATESSPEFDAELREWETNVRVRGPWSVLGVDKAQATGGVVLEKQSDGALLATGENPITATYTLTVPGPLKDVTAFRLQALTDPSLPKNGPGRSPYGNAVLSKFQVSIAPALPKGRFVRIRVPGAQRYLHLAEVQVFRSGTNIAPSGAASQSSTAFEGAARLAIDGDTEGHYFNGRSVSHTERSDNPWWELDLGGEEPVDKIVVWNRTDSGEDRIVGARVVLLDANRATVFQETIDSLPTPSVELQPALGCAVPLQNASADYIQMGWEPDHALDPSPATGWAFYPEVGRPHGWVAETRQPLHVSPHQVLRVTIDHSSAHRRHTLGKFRVSVTTQPPPVRELPGAVKTILAKDGPQRTPEEQGELAAYFRPVSKVVARILKEAEAKKNALAQAKPVELPILSELPPEQKRPTQIMIQGNFRALGEKVEPALPAAFHPRPPGEINRLALARWIVAPENPLTARVAVNRFWAQIFGTGLVETEEDFGAQGRPPSHPELLDWLAVEWMQPSDPLAQPWDVKRLLRLIVTSATYRQNSRLERVHLEKDPGNRLLARGPRRRLDAETLRDQALELAGLLSAKRGGPSVYPPQPEGFWRVAFNERQNNYPTSTGEDRWRRSLYTLWRRSVPNPTQSSFDAPSRETCALRRAVTNTPLQALVALNDPVFFECAQGLARRILKEGGHDIDSRLRYALKLCLGQPGEREQLATLKELFEREFIEYQGTPGAAAKLCDSPVLPVPPASNAAELAAWTSLANVLLNLDVVLTNH